MSTDTPLRPPGPKSRFPGSLLLDFRRDPLGFLQGLAREHGPVAGFSIGPQKLFMINEPALIQELLVAKNKHFVKAGALRRAKAMLGEGLLTSEGEHHLRQRRMLQPAFHQKRVAAYAEGIVAQARALADSWHDGQEVDLGPSFLHLSLAIVATALFGAELADQAAAVERDVDALLATFHTLTLPMGEQLFKLPTPTNRRARAALARLDGLVYRLIEERRGQAEERFDLLSMLLLAQDAEGDGSGMDARAVRDEAFTVLVAGHETTANAITWLFYALSQAPEVRARLETEIAGVLGDRPPTAEDLARLPYAAQVLSESLRLYPPGWAMGRQAAEEVALGDYRIPRGAMVFVSPFVTHRDPRFFPDPERFDPERWTPEARAARPKFAYFPFGGGARGCIGEHFAWMTALLVLVTLVQRFRFALAPGQAIGFEPLITLRPRWGMRMRLSAR